MYREPVRLTPLVKLDSSELGANALEGLLGLLAERAVGLGEDDDFIVIDVLLDGLLCLCHVDGWCGAEKATEKGHVVSW